MLDDSETGNKGGQMLLSNGFAQTWRLFCLGRGSSYIGTKRTHGPLTLQHDHVEASADHFRVAQ